MSLPVVLAEVKDARYQVLLRWKRVNENKGLPHYSIEVKKVKSSCLHRTCFFVRRKTQRKMLRMELQSSGCELKEEKNKVKVTVK